MIKSLKSLQNLCRGAVHLLPRAKIPNFLIIKESCLLLFLIKENVSRYFLILSIINIHEKRLRKTNFYYFLSYLHNKHSGEY